MTGKRVRWWQAWIVAGAAAILLPLPWSVVAAAPFALWAGWTLTEHTCGWCGRGFHGQYDWCCPTCAERADLP